MDDPVNDWSYEVSNSWIRDTSVSAMARFTYILLKGFEGKDGEAAFPELPTLAWLLGWHRETAQVYLRELATAGWIKKIKKKNARGQFQSVRYILLRHRSEKKPLREKPEAENLATITSQSLSVVVARTEAEKPRCGEIPKSKTTTTTNLEDLIAELKQKYPQHNIGYEFERCRAHYAKLGKKVTATHFRKWMARAELPLDRPKPKRKALPPPEPSPPSPDDDDPDGTARFLEHYQMFKARKHRSSPEPPAKHDAAEVEIQKLQRETEKQQ